jgi:hypothetical protein
MTTSNELVALLFQIRSASSPLQKLKLISLAWRTIRGLKPAERQVLARELGFDGAEALVEELGERTWLSPSLLLGAVHRAEKADPGELRKLLSGVLSKDMRKESAKTALRALEGWLGRELGVEEGEQEPPVAAPPDVEAETAAAMVDEASEEEEREAPAVGSDGASSWHADVPFPVPAPADLTVEEVEERHDQKPEPGTPPKPEVAPVEMPRAQPAPPIAVASAWPETPPALPSHEALKEEPARPVLLPGDEPEAADEDVGLVRRLGRLAQAGGGGSDPVAEVASFPQGWARRRAVVAVLRRGLARDFDQALALVDTLEAPSDRMWALATLIDAFDLDSEKAQTLRDRLSDSAALWRLDLRLKQKGILLSS